MIGEELIDFLEHLVPSNKEVGTTSNTVASLPQLFNFVISGYSSMELSCYATVVMVDALSLSSLPLFGYPYKQAPKIDVSLRRYQHTFHDSLRTDPLHILFVLLL